MYEQCLRLAREERPSIWKSEANRNERKKENNQKKTRKRNAMRQKTKGELMKNTNRERKKGKEKTMNSLYASMSLRRFLEGKKVWKLSCAVECWVVHIESRSRSHHPSHHCPIRLHGRFVLDPRIAEGQDGPVLDLVGSRWPPTGWDPLHLPMVLQEPLPTGQDV